MNLSEPLLADSTPGDAAEGGASQSVKAQLRLREMILAGELPGGARIAELAIVEKLGVSRTPIRAALMRLEQEGWIETDWGISETNRKVKFYSLTKAGRKQLAVEAGEWDRMATAIGRVMKLA